MTTIIHDISPIVTLGLQTFVSATIDTPWSLVTPVPPVSKLITSGYGPEIFIEILPGTEGPSRRGKKKKKDEDFLIRVRVIDEDGKVMMQEQTIPFDDLKKIKIVINESGSFIHGSDIYVRIKEQSIKEGDIHKIRIKADETIKRQESNS